jgi:radical SAM superfamily enzyme YgiQ (UPF0313 family)
MGLKTIGLVMPDKESDFPKWERGVSLPSLTMEAVAASIDTDAEIKIIDETVHSLDLNERFDLVGISINTATAARGYELARHFKNNGAYVVMGGVHAAVLPEEALSYADSVVIGEAEGAFQKLINDILSGNPKRIYSNDKPFDLSKLRRPRRDLHVKSGDNEAIKVEASRGCSNNCSFCHHLPYSHRPIDDVVQEISELDSNLFSFADPNLGADRDFAVELLKRIWPAGKKWAAEVQSSIFLDDEFLFYASQTGCIGLLVGYESVNHASIKEAGKRFNKPEDYIKGIELAHKHGIMVKGSFVFGFDNDAKGCFDECARLAVDMNLDLALFNVLTPYPGTRLFNKLQSEKRLLYTDFPEDWSNYKRTKAVFQPKNMAPEELEQGVRHCWEEFYSIDSIEKRFSPSYRASSMQADLAYRSNIGANGAFSGVLAGR